jgi:hypothetical protein
MDTKYLKENAYKIFNQSMIQVVLNLKTLYAQNVQMDFIFLKIIDVEL